MALKIILFDVDGTLVLSGGAGIRALNRVLERVHGVERAMEGIKPDGMTDHRIIREIFKNKLGREPSPEEIQAVCREYLPVLEEEVSSSPGFRVMPGVVSFLECLASQSGILCGLTTGNLEKAARIKLERPGLNRFFPFGGFGSDSENRSELTGIGLRRGLAYARTDTAQAIVVGDTIKDIQAGRSIGALTIAVSTGSTSYETLAGENPDLVLQDLSIPGPFLDFLDLAQVHG